MHTLLSDLRAARSAPVIVQWGRGMALPFRAVALLWRNRSLWPWAAAPAMIGLLLFAGVATGAVAYADDLLALWWAQPSGEGIGPGLLRLVWTVLYVVLLVVGVASAYLTALLLGGIIASPFNDALSVRVEALLDGEAPPEDDAGMWAAMGRSVVSTAGVTATYVTVAVPVLALNLIPAIGPPVATVLHAGVAAFFLAVEYADVAFARYGLPWRDKLRVLNAHRGLAAGFGLSTSLLMWIPGLNLIVMPIAVVGGTALGRALAE
jgi:CysZ protein